MREIYKETVNPFKLEMVVMTGEKALEVIKARLQDSEIVNVMKNFLRIMNVLIWDWYGISEEPQICWILLKKEYLQTSPYIRQRAAMILRMCIM